VTPTSNEGQFSNYTQLEDVPVLLLVFNRPNHTRQVINRLREIGARHIYVSSDAADQPKSQDRVDRVRRIVTEEIDWDCDVTINLRSENRGLRLGVLAGIDWFFSKVEEGIILEDDCLPSRDFFRFCAELLPLYRRDCRIFHIAGENSADVKISQPWSYCFVQYPHIWGWATWKRAWALYDRDLSSWGKFEAASFTQNLFSSADEEAVWAPIFRRLHTQGFPDTWDWQWSLTLRMNGGLAAQPVENLVTNIGFGPEATHTTHESSRSNRPIGRLGIIKHPEIVFTHKNADAQIFKNTQSTLGAKLVSRSFLARLKFAASAYLKRK